MCPLTVALIIICSVLVFVVAYLIVKLKYLKQDLKDMQDVNAILNHEIERGLGNIR